MGILSGYFLLIAVLVAVGQRLLPWQGARTALLTAANVVFFASFARGAWTLLPLLAFLLQGWVCITWVNYKQSQAALVLSVTWMLVLFVVLRQYTFVPTFLQPVDVFVNVGLSYILFRVLHLIIDSGTGGKIEGLTPVSYFNYTCLFLSLISGPIQRYEDYRREEQRTDLPPIDGPLLFASAARAVVGLAKLVLLAPIGLAVHQMGLTAVSGQVGQLASAPVAVQLATAMLAYLLFLFWNFSGYMDVILAAAKLMGLALPENFNKPFLAGNIIDFWARWHITLSDWFRVYLFNPVVGFLTRVRTDVKMAPYYGVVGFFITSFVMGVWHGSTGVFIVYGLMLGVGLSLTKLFQIVARNRLGKKGYRALTENQLYIWGCNAMTIGFLSLAVCCFWLEWSDLVRLLRSIGFSGLVGGFAIAAGVCLVVAIVRDGLRWASARTGLGRALEHPMSRQALVALGLVLLVLYAALNKSDAPPFVYAGF